MPATLAGKGATPFVLGADGCRAGWAVIRLNLTACGAASAQASVERSFQDVFYGPGVGAAMIIVDMPIGLMGEGRRACERSARAILKPLRASSVFAAPRRPMLTFDDYASANAWGKRQGQDAGGGLSKQAWMITPKIREIDEAIMPDDQVRLGEGHPEVAFYRLNGEHPCKHAKRTLEGKAERRTLLRQHGIRSAHKIYEMVKLKHRAGVGEDDVYDACALALTAKARLKGKALQLTNGARDARGLLMEIWG